MASSIVAHLRISVMDPEGNFTSNRETKVACIIHRETISIQKNIENRRGGELKSGCDAGSSRYLFFSEKH